LEIFRSLIFSGGGILERVAGTAKRSFISGVGWCWWYKKVNTVVNAAVFFWQNESYMTTQIVVKTV
jgi:hypothetical protein